MTVRVAQAIAMVVLLVFAISAAAFAVTHWTLEDMQTYLDAALRLRNGETLYATTNPLAAYQYAPWFAFAWIPATYLPRDVVAIAWSTILVGASLVAVLPLVRRSGAAALAAIVLFLPILLFSSARSGNVQPLLVAMLVLGLETRLGPLAIAVAASLKAFPLAFVLVYVGRREWRRALATAALTAILVAPMLAFDLDLYTADAARPGTLYAVSPFAWAIPVLVAAAATLLLAGKRSPRAWLSAALTVVLALPRMLTYDLTFLLASLPDARRRTASARPTSTKLTS